MKIVSGFLTDSLLGFSVLVFATEKPPRNLGCVGVYEGGKAAFISLV